MFRSLLTLLILVFAHSAFAYQRVVLLAPAAGDIFAKLGAQSKVVGVTRSNNDFPEALKIGSHIKPNIELIKGLEPDLLVISSNRFFSEQLAAQIDADVIKYNPTDLSGVLVAINQFGELLNKPSQARQLIADLKSVQAQIKPLDKSPTVVFEVTQSPFMVAGKHSIVNGIISAAGGQLIGPENRKIGKFNLENIFVENPDYYFYQVGPMNKNPTLPKQRANYQIINSKFMKVDQLAFSRATTASFDLALSLNKLFRR